MKGDTYRYGRRARYVRACGAICCVDVRRAPLQSLALGAGAVAIAVFAASSVPAPVAAQENTLLGQEVTVDQTNPMLLQADELIYDNQNMRVTARGNVEIYYNGYTLLADQVVYDQSANTLQAEGNVRIKEPDGAIVNADRITLTDDFREGFIGSLRIVTKEDARIAAAVATRQEGNTTVFERGVFTPCKPCEDDPDKAPLWQIKAAKVIHKKDEGSIYYEDASFEFFGVPVAWIPFFYHPDPSIKRRSGFLVPEVKHSDDLGFTTEVPYYFEIAPNMDFTFSPRFTTKQGILWQGEWRHRLANGAYSIEMAGIYQNDSDEDDIAGQTPLENEWRGSLVTEGRFSLGSWWQAGWDVTLESDDTFRRFYDLDNVINTDRVSSAYLEGINDRNYFGAYLYHFGGLLAEDNAESESRVHPVIDYNYVFANPVVGGELSFDTNVQSLSRDDGTDSNRLIAQINWRRQLIDQAGQVFTPFASLRGDVYSLSNNEDPITGVSEEDEFISRGMATGGLEYSYPFVAHTERGSHVIEPVAQVIARPDSTDQIFERLDDTEDAKSLVFDDTLLFDIDKSSGYDRIEIGVRANYGLRYTMQLNDGGYARAVVGASQHVAGENPYDEGTGLGSDASDLVAGVYIEPNRHFRLFSQSRFDNSSFELMRQDASGSVSYGAFRGRVNYAFTRATPRTEFTENQHEVVASSRLQIADHWFTEGSIRYDLENSEILTDSVGLEYHDECFILNVTYREEFFQDRDVNEDRSIMVRLEFKHLGGTTFETDAIGTLEADSEKL